MTQPASTAHYFCCACHMTPGDHCDECKHLCEPASTDLDAQLEEILKAYKRYPYGTEDSPHITGDDAKQALTKLIAQREQAAELRGRVDELKHLVIDENYRDNIATDAMVPRAGIRVRRTILSDRLAELRKEDDK